MKRYQIQYLPYDEIDKNKWDACIDSAPNGLIYAYSFYLDHMAKYWDALVLGDYEIVMPLTWNKKYGQYYLYQPSFTASLGLFGTGIKEHIVSEFIAAIPSKFRLIEISLNAGNIFSYPTGFSILRNNYILNLNKPYEEISRSYRENHKRNIAKANKPGFTLSKDILIDDIIRLNKEQLKHIEGVKAEDYINFRKLFLLLQEKQQAMVYGIGDPSNRLLASAVFFFSHKRAYYILVGNHPDGKTIGASHSLIDAFIKDHSNKDLLLDFEGSDIRNLAFFYSGFGAVTEIYPALSINKLPWYVRIFK